MERLDLVKLVMENDLNKDMIKKLLKVIKEITDNVFNNMDNRKILEVMGNDMEILKNYYKTIIDSIEKFEG